MRAARRIAAQQSDQDEGARVHLHGAHDEVWMASGDALAVLLGEHAQGLLAGAVVLEVGKVGGLDLPVLEGVGAVATVTTVTYTGHELIAQAGLIDMGARLYDRQTGLFISPDPTVAHPDDSQDLDQYAYVQDNPMSRVDRWGLSSTSGAGSPHVLPPITISQCNALPTSPGCPGSLTLLPTNPNVAQREGWGMRRPTADGARSGIPGHNKPQGNQPPTTLPTILITPTVAPSSQGLLAQLMFAESAGVPAAYPAIGWSIVNRVGAPGFPKTLAAVIFEPNQYASIGGPLWNAAENPSQLTGPNAISYGQALNVANGILSGTIPDPTGGATFFYSGDAPPSGFFQNGINSGALVPTYTNGPFTFLIQH